MSEQLTENMLHSTEPEAKQDTREMELAWLQAAKENVPEWSKAIHSAIHQKSKMYSDVMKALQGKR